MTDIALKHLQYKFNNIELFWQAVTHGSWINENKKDGKFTDNQRLEFLGDSVLKLVQGTILHEKFPNWSEGQLTQVRSFYENNKNLGTWTQKLGIDQYIRHGKSINQKSNSWGQICAEVFEAVIGAIWIDCKYDFNVMIDVYMKWNLQLDEERVIANPKKDLQEFLHSKNLSLPVYTVVKKEGPDHMPTFTVNCSVKDLQLFLIGQANSIKEAEKNSAEQMIKKLQSINIGESQPIKDVLSKHVEVFDN